MRLADKVIIVTGGGRGIGRAYSLALAAEGARVVVAADTTDPAPAVKEIEARGGQALGVHCDVSRENNALELATKTVDRFGRIDVLVNNAALYGTLKRRPFMEIPVEEWDQVMAVNLRGIFLCARARELGDFGIRVNAVAPGFTLSGENEKNVSEDGKAANVRMRMLKRAEVPDDIVGTVVFLASDESDFITGQTIAVDGGLVTH